LETYVLYKKEKQEDRIFEEEENRKNLAIREATPEHCSGISSDTDAPSSPCIELCFMVRSLFTIPNSLGIAFET
jgi:hypothetical protein